MIGLSDRQVAILRGILGACLDDAARDGLLTFGWHPDVD